MDLVPWNLIKLLISPNEISKDEYFSTNLRMSSCIKLYIAYNIFKFYIKNW
jgi:hypothetical protein